MSRLPTLRRRITDSSGVGIDPRTPPPVPTTPVQWIDERVGAGGFIRFLLWRKVPKGTDWFSTMGVAALFAFANQAITGVFLAMYYRPDAAGGAYESVRYITDDVFLGEFVRAMHKWGASVMVICVFLHMGINFFMGAYKYPREMTWIIGVVLLILTLTMAFTGYLLPFNQRAYWATIVGVDINGTAPFIGPLLSDFLRSGPEFAASTLSRFYAIHMLVIPGAIVVLITGHLYLVVKLGTTAPTYIKPDESPELVPRDPV